MMSGIWKISQQESWLIFNRDVSHLSDDGNSSLAVEIAFWFIKAESERISSVQKVIPIRLVCFFAN